jgi:hypothetical protein
MHNTAPNLSYPLSVVIYIVAWPEVSSLVRFGHRGCLSLWSRVFLSRAREFEALHVRRPLVPVRPHLTSSLQKRSCCRSVSHQEISRIG